MGKDGFGERFRVCEKVRCFVTVTYCILFSPSTLAHLHTFFYIAYTITYSPILLYL
jgi:hypothetical protein